LSTIVGGVGVLTYLFLLPVLLISQFPDWTSGWRRSGQSTREEGERREMSTGKFEIAFELGIVVYVEMALKWNHISNVHSLSTPGQFMPFFIALAQLVTTLYRLGKYAIMKGVEDDYVREGDEDECPHKDHVDGSVNVALDDLKPSTPQNSSGVISTNV